MRRVAVGLVALGFQHVATGSVLECGDQSDCVASSDDPSLIQLAGISNKVQQPESAAAEASFVKASKPFISPPGALLKEEGKLIITEDGVENTYYLPGAPTLDGGKTVKYQPPYRYYLMKTPTTDYSNRDNFYQPNWIGKTFTVDFDFEENGAGCGCNINFYLVDMPVPEAGKDNDHYCDAQCFPGLGCCPEFDMNEGNAMVQQITNHACTHDYAEHPDWACNKWGDPELKTHPSDFSPGDGHTINSNKPFTWKQVFEGGSEMTFTTTISQEGRDVTLRMGPGNSQLNSMMKDIENGMAFVTGYWFAADMNWLDNEECGTGAEHCNEHPVYLKNWRIDTNGGPAPPPAPPGPPTPPSPSPSPPAPPPAPPSAGGGKCCWGPNGSNCKGGDDWCNLSLDNCWECTGGYYKQ